MTVVGILVGPGRRAFDIAVVREVYDDRSDRGLPRADVRLLAARAVTDLDAVHAVRRTHGLASVTELDLLVVPGSEDPLGESTRQDVDAVSRAVDAGVVVASLCTGAFTLAAAGVLDGRTATTHWRYAGDLARRHPGVEVRPRDLYCGDGEVWTSAGVTAGIDLLLHLVRSGWGAGAAEVVARSMVTPVFRPGTQTQFADTRMQDDASPTVERLQLAVSRELSRHWSVKDLAAVCSMSSRTFHRWFGEHVGTTPISWLNDLRVREAQRLLEQGDLSVASIARSVGYGSDDLLRKHFSSRMGTTPTAHAAAFHRAPQARLP